MEITSNNEQAFLRWLYWIGLIPTAIAVLMQMNEVRGGFITNYLADIAGPIWCYAIIRLRKVAFKNFLPKNTPLISAILVFSIGTIWEILEAFDFSGTPLAITRGRFDPFDILCYAISLAVCYIIDDFYQKRIPNSDSGKTV